LEDLKGRDHLECLGVGGRIILKLVIRKDDVKSKTGFNFFRIRPNGWFCERCKRLLGFITNFLTKQLSAFPEGLCSVEWVDGSEI
jgi:hypothetical protein